jgi:lipoprotein LprG
MIPLLAGARAKGPLTRTHYDAGMQTPARLAVLFTSLVTATLLIAGCSSNSKSESLPDAATLLADSNKTTRDLQSVHLELVVTGEIKEFPITSLSGDLTNTPAVAAQGKAGLIFLGQKLDDVDFVVIGGTLYGALTAGSWTDFGPAADIYDVAAILSPDKGLANVLASFSNPKTDSRETLNGVETVKVTGDVSADAVNKIAPQIAATEPVPGTAWISTDGKNNLVQAKLDVTKDSNVQMTLSKWDQPVAVTKPAM